MTPNHLNTNHPQSDSLRPANATSGSTREESLARVLAVGLAMITLALYWPATGCGFLDYDDQVYVTENPRVQSGLTPGNVVWAFTDGHALNWHPLTWLSLMLDVNLFGRKASGFHLTNITLHAANAVLLFWLLRQLTGATWRSGFVAALFAWHPAHVESVAWVSERKDVLSTFFGFLSLIFYARYAQKRSPNPNVSFFLSLGCFALGLMSKPMLVTWPFVMLLLDCWPLGRISSFQPSAFSLQPFLEKIPFFALAAAASVVAFAVQKSGGAVMSFEDVPLGMRAGNAVVSYCRYLATLCWPVNLSVFYPHPGQWPVATVVMAVMFLGGFSAACWSQRRRRPFLPMGWLWYGGTLVPAIGLVQVGTQSMADRYTYIPSVGLLILVVWSAHALTTGGRWQGAGRPAVVVVLALCLVLTRRQLGYWQNSETLFEHAIAVTKNNDVAEFNLGVAFLEHRQFDAAISHFQKAVQLQPKSSDARYDLAFTLALAGKTESAIQQYEETIRRHPACAPARENLGLLLAGQGRVAEATNQFQAAIQISPEEPRYHENFGNVLVNLGRVDAAIHEFQEAIRLQPDLTDARKHLGLALARQGKIAEAISQFQRVIQLNPVDVEARSNLGIALFREGQTAAAIQQFREAIRLKPDFVEARNNLGAALAKEGRWDEAISQFQEAIRLRPDFAEAQKSLARALAQQHATTAGATDPAKP